MNAAHNDVIFIFSIVQETLCFSSLNPRPYSLMSKMNIVTSFPGLPLEFVPWSGNEVTCTVTAALCNTSFMSVHHD